MTSLVALLRGINVGGHAQIAMGDLREFMEYLGCSEVRSLLQSGNLVFKSKLSSETAVEKMLEENAPKHLGRPIEFMVRNATAWRQILDDNPLTDEAAKDPARLLVMFLKREPDKGSAEPLRSSITGCEYFQLRGRQLYLCYPDGSGRSKFTGALIEKKLGIRGTSRNWNTVQKIAALLASP